MSQNPGITKADFRDDPLPLATTERDVLAFVSNPEPLALQSVLAEGDLSRLNAPQRLQFLAAVSRSLGLNPLTRPFEFITLNGKIRMYATRDCTDQMRRIHGVSVQIMSRDTVNDVHIVRTRAKTPDGREDESIGALSVKGLQGEAMANALMKCETKSKRRVTLSICGLGFLDESEVDGAKHEAWEQPANIGDYKDPMDQRPDDAPVDGGDFAWREFYPDAWKDGKVGGVMLGGMKDPEIGVLWKKNPLHPALCAWAADWILYTIAQIPDCEWEEIAGKVPGTPPNILECNPANLWAIAAHLRKMRAS